MDRYIPFHQITAPFRRLFAATILMLALMHSVVSAALVPGDIAFVGMNTDGNTDAFAFVALKNIPAGETIRFTDAGWKLPENEFYGSETWVSYTVPSGGLSAGTVVTLYLSGNLSNLGDQVTAYQGAPSSPNIIAAINNFGSTWQSTADSEHSTALPKGLSDGHTAVAIPHLDNIVYSGPFTGSQANLLQAINSPSNWSGSNTYQQQFNNLSFNVAGGAPIVTMGDFDYADEAGGSMQILVHSDRTGSHSVSIAATGGDAQAGLDYSISPGTLSFSGSRTAVATLTLLDDADCESLEHLVLGLTANGSVSILSNGIDIAIADNEATTFSTQQGFESSPADTWAYAFFPGSYNSETGPDPQTIDGQEAVWTVIKSFGGMYFAPGGDYFWGMQDIDNNIGGGSFWHTLDFQPVNLQDVEEAVVQFKYFTFNSTPQDAIEYAVAYDNGTAWPSYIPLPFNSNGWNTVTVNVPASATHVRLRVRAKENNGLLCGGIDEVSLTGIVCGTNNSLQTLPTDSLLCAGGGTLQVPFAATGNFVAGNVFTAEISNASGSFANPIAIGTLALAGIDPSGVIQGTVPASLPAGTGYRVRVASSAPAMVGTDNGLDIVISQLGLSATAFTYSNGHKVSCPGSQDGSVDLTVTSGQAPFSFAWTGPGGFTASTEDISGLAAGSYSVVVTDAAACTGTINVLLTAPSFSLSLQATDISCAGQQDGSISAAASGGATPYSYTWSGNGSVFTTNTVLFPNLSAGSYSVTVTDANGCSLSDSATVTEPAALQATATSPLSPCGTSISCAGGSDGLINLDVTGGTSPYTYNWTGPNGFASAQEDLSGLAAGTYSVTVTDANGCTDVSNMLIEEPSVMGAGIDAIAYACGFNISCNGAADGAAFAVGVTGGCPPYSYLWSNGDTNATATGLAAGPYSLTITDAGGCSIVRDVTLTEPYPISTSIVSNPASCTSALDGSIDMNTSGGCAPYQYAWTGPGGFVSTEEHPDSLAAGTYNYTITDPNGCSLSGSVVVQALDNISATIGCCQDTVICSGESIDIAVEFTGTGPFELWYLVNGDSSLMLAPTGTSYITIAPTSGTQIELLSVASMFSGCEGEVCGSATIGVNDCESSCADLCVVAGVANVADNGNCRTVDLEIACDSACTANAGACPGTQVLTFDQDPNGNPIPAGTVVGNQWASMGVTFSFINNNPNTPPAGVIFDSSNPTGGDFDLGTPHADFGGPGIGTGGAQGAPGQNDTPLGNLLVLAENVTDANNDGLIDDPDDEGAGGELQMNFAYPYFLESMSIVDLDNGNGFIRVEQTGNRITDFNIPGLGDNAVTTVAINLDSVVQVRVILPGSGGISALAFCPTSPGFVDISVPCGDVSSYSNSAGLPMTLIERDSTTGITGIRVWGLPGNCSDSTAQGPFTVSYTVCNLASTCAGSFCAPLLAFAQDGCVQYEMAGMGPVIPTAPEGPGKENPIAEGLRGSIGLYPNPVADAATLQLFLREGGAVRVDVYNVAGKRMATAFSGDLQAGEMEERGFHVGHWTDGIYVLRMVTASGEVFSHKFILNKQ